MYTEKDRDVLIEYAKEHLADLIPYDDPRYEERLQEWAENYAESEIHPDPEFESLCNYHDELLEKGLLDEPNFKNEENKNITGFQLDAGSTETNIK